MILMRVLSLIVAHENVRARMSTERFTEAFGMMIPAYDSLAGETPWPP
jgi:hypothetical protein